jgi:hypothetical protein
MAPTGIMGFICIRCSYTEMLTTNNRTAERNIADHRAKLGLFSLRFICKFKYLLLKSLKSCVSHVYVSSATSS